MQGTNPDATLVDLCNDCIAWSKEEKRTFLRHRVQSRLAAIYVDLKNYDECIKLISDLLREVLLRRMH